MSNESTDRPDELAAWMQRLAEVPVDAPRLPDPHLLWWKAELLVRWDAQRQVTRPIERAEPIQVGIGIVGAATLLVSLWPHVPSGGGVGIAAMLTIVLLVAVFAFKSRGVSHE